jgi:PAS domain S-box-containing protein
MPHRSLDPTQIPQLFEGLLDAAPDGMLICDQQGQIRVANTQAEAMLGYEPGQIVGQSIEVLIPPELRERHAGHRARYNAAPTTRQMGIGLALVAQRQDGSEVPVEISLRPLELGGATYVVAAIRDITERRMQTEALARSNEALQQFAYVASHDLQEPLRMVSSYLQLLERRYKDKLDEDAREFIGFAVDGAKRMQALIHDLLAYSRVGQPDVVHVKVDLNEVVRQVLDDLALTIEESGARVSVGPLPTVNGEPGQLGQVFQNLLSNALKFRKPDQPPVIEATAHRQDEGWAISVRDEGIGIEPQYADRIFQIFQRLHTRHEYPGTGIGLAICKRIVEQHGGTIRLDSQLGVGSTFTFTLPDRKRPWPIHR